MTWAAGPLLHNAAAALCDDHQFRFVIGSGSCAARKLVAAGQGRFPYGARTGTLVG
jgi:hypothetical protein